MISDCTLRRLNQKAAEDPTTPITYYNDVAQLQAVLFEAGPTPYYVKRNGRLGFTYKGEIHIYGQPDPAGGIR